VQKNIANLLIIISVFLLSVSCCHKSIPNITAFSDHPFSKESGFFIVHELRVPEGDPEAGALIVSHTGSGAVVRSTKNYSDIITAGHLCHTPKEFSIFDDEFVVFDHQGNYYKSDLIAISYEIDLCILRINYQKPVIPIAKKDPNQGSKVYMAGFPMGVYHPNYIHFFDGYYSGTDYGGNSIWTFPAAPGSSGGVVVNSYGQIVGVVSAVYSEFSHLTIGPGVEQVSMFIRESQACSIEKICYID
tara:strand:+ start:223 stop:957 length:735 start_codon:yes stop_codon:yes gene_type:complete